MGVLDDHARAQDVVQDVFLRLWRRPESFDAQRAALRGLPDGQREAVVLTYWGGLTAEEVARHAEVPLGTAKSRVRLGVMRLRETYDVSDAAAA